jgi:hypothetical protein
MALSYPPFVAPVVVVVAEAIELCVEEWKIFVTENELNI